MRTILALTLCAIVAWPSQAPARSWPSTGGWDIAEVESGCGITSDFEGEGATTFTLLRQTDDTVVLSIANSNWTARAGQKYPMSFVLNGVSYAGTTVGTGESYGPKGFITKFGLEFLSDLARASGIRIYLGEQLVDNLSLSGSAAALRVVDQCVSSLKARHAAEQRERDRLAHIPKDPFASYGPVEPTPVSSADSWITADDYPIAAFREGREGTVRVELTVSADGSVAGCRVASSSGSPDLDEATCAVLKRRGRFNPAKDAAGKAIEGMVPKVVNWRIPK